MSNRETTHNPFQDQEQPPSRRRRKSRRRRRWPIFLLAMLALIAVLPNLMGWLGLHQNVIDYAVSDLEGRITVEEASLGWLQPLVLSNVTGIDPEGNELFTAEKISTTKSLLGLLNISDLGELRIDSPTVYLHLRPDGSNLEDAVAAYMTSPQVPATDASDAKTGGVTTMPAMTIRISNGRALISSATDTLSWQIDEFNAIAQVGSEVAPLIIESDCNVTPMQVDGNGQLILQNPGSLQLQSQFDTGAASLQFTSIDLAVSSDNIPLSIAGPLVERFAGPAKSTGQLSGNFQSQILVAEQSVKLQVADVQLREFIFAAPQLLGPDRVSVNNLLAQGSFELSPSAIASSNFDIQSDFGHINANGRFDIEQLEQLSNGGQLLESPFQMDGEIDLAGLVRMMPTTFQLHEDLQIESGTVRFQAGTRSEESIPRLIVNMDAANLKARRGGKNIVWQKPLRLAGTIAQSSQGLVLEDALCESDFLTVAGHASWETAAFRFKGDLSELMNRVSEFVDLQETQMAGQIDGSLGWQTAQPENASQSVRPMQLGGRFTVTNPMLQLPGLPAWKESRVQVSLSASGQSRIQSPDDESAEKQSIRIMNGGVQVDVGTEKLIATLAQPIESLTSDPIQLNCEMTGNLDGWLRQIQGFVDIGDVRAAGDLGLTCVAAMNNDQLMISNLEYKVQQLEFDGYGVKIDDPELAGSAPQMIYDLNSGLLSIPDTTLVAQSIAARGQNIEILVAEQMSIDGVMAYRADVNRVADWLELSPTEESVFWFGTAEGNVQFQTKNSLIHAQVDSTFKDLVAARRVPTRPNGGAIQVSNTTQWQQVFAEPQAHLSSDLNLAADMNAVEFRSLAVDSSALSVRAVGTISELATRMVTNLQGTWNPNWDKVRNLLAAYTSNLVQLAGSGDQRFLLRGPIFSQSTDAATPWVPAQLEAQASLGWDQGSLASVPVGPGAFDVVLREGIANVNSNGVSFSGGTLNLTPTVDLRNAEPVLRIQQTRVIDNVALSPETARQWLKYVAPLVADATSAKGTITLDANNLEVPLINPMNTHADANVVLTDVVIGAGPIAEQLLSAVTQLRTLLKPESANSQKLSTWLQMSEQTVPVKVKNQRVYHENLTLRSHDLVLRTNGSVGFDQSLQVVAQILIADDWIAGKPYLASLKGKSISIPITGTVTRPKLDIRSIRQLSTQLVKQAAGDAINNVVGEKLNPKIDQFQNQFNNKVNNELNRFQNQLNEKLGGALLPKGSNSAPANGASQQNLGNQLEAELKKGIGNLFGGGKN